MTPIRWNTSGRNPILDNCCLTPGVLGLSGARDYPAKSPTKGNEPTPHHAQGGSLFNRRECRLPNDLRDLI